MKYEKSKLLFHHSRQIIPGGVNSPVRAFRSVGGDPVFIQKSKGSKIWDADGNEYIDYVCSWGPHLFGHNPDFVLDAVKEALDQGMSYGAPCESEIKLAELICEMVPSIEMVRMVNSGTEATMSAIRLARGYTGREKIIKFEGCYHGHGDSFLIKAGSGALTFGVPTSPGVTSGTAADTLIADFNDIESVKKLVSSNKNEIAAIIIEPIAGNMGVVPSDPKFLSELRDICSEESIILIFDEVMTGFRVAAGGVQELFGIMPDLTTLGKIIGGGLPVGAYGGKREIMEQVSPSGPVYQAGTLSGNPIAMAAGIAMLTHIKENPEIYQQLEEKGEMLENEIKSAIQSRQMLAPDGDNFGIAINRCGSMMTMFFNTFLNPNLRWDINYTSPDSFLAEKEGENPPLSPFYKGGKVWDYASAVKSDITLYANFFHKMLEQGIYLPPSQFEAWFISTAHTEEDLKRTVDAVSRSI